MLLMPVQGTSTNNRQTTAQTVTAWKAGERLSEETVRQMGIDRLFVVGAISDKTFQRMVGKSYKKNCTVPRSSLRYLKVVHRNLKGETVVGELVCHKRIAHDLIAIFKALYQASYPIERMVLVDDYNADDEQSMLHKIYFFGNGACKCMPAINHDNACLIEGIEPLARHMIPLAEKRMAQGQIEDVAYFVPFYLKDFVAKTPRNMLTP